MILIVYLVILSAYFNIVFALTVAFLIGILKNLWFGETIGSASLLYICIVYAIHLYKRKFNARSWGFLFFVSVIVILVTEAIETGSVSFSQIHLVRALLTSFASMVLFKIVYKLWGPIHDERKLPV